jgi:RNA polymerase sigma factor (sigma-70 family)
MTTLDFNNLVVTNYTHLKPFAFRFTGNEESANDLMQDTIFQALRHKDKFKEGSNFKAWLYTIMRNFFINGYRSRRNKKEVEFNINAISYNTAARSGNSVSDIFFCKDILKMIKSIPEVFSTPLLLYCEGYHYKEISYLLKLSLGTVKSRIHFARKLLRADLADNGYCEN